MGSCEKATFAAGCFWGVEEVFRTLPGVLATRVGYTGGIAKKPSYEQVCSGLTGHAEAVEVEFDPARIHYAKLLDVFWNCHDPSSLNRQGPDVGTQYRSAIFFHTPEQERLALQSRRRLNQMPQYNKVQIVTQIEAASTFWPAEEYHQKYLQKHGINFCH